MGSKISDYSTQINVDTRKIEAIPHDIQLCENTFQYSGYYYPEASSFAQSSQRTQREISGGYSTLPFHLIGSAGYLHKSLNFFAPLVPLREQMPLLGFMDSSAPAWP
jgi:hypothetical protein